MWHIRRPPLLDCFMATRLGRPLTQRALAKQRDIEEKL
jgi:hypothetical protein